MMLFFFFFKLWESRVSGGYRDTIALAHLECLKYNPCICSHLGSAGLGLCYLLGFRKADLRRGVAIFWALINFFFFFFSGAGRLILCCCLLCIHPLCPRTSRQCDGFFFFPPVLAPGAPEGHLPRHPRRHRSHHPEGGGGGGGVVGLGPRHAGSGPAFVSLFVSAAARPRAGGARAATPEEAGPRRGAPPGVHFTAAAAALVCSDTPPCPCRCTQIPGRGRPDPSRASSPPNPALGFSPSLLVLPR